MSQDSSNSGTWDIHPDCGDGQTPWHQLIIGNCDELESFAQIRSTRALPRDLKLLGYPLTVWLTSSLHQRPQSPFQEADRSHGL